MHPEIGVPWQLPPAHTSPLVQGCPSSQRLVLLAWAQPVAGTQLSVVQTFPSSQLTGGPLTQAPPEHVSFAVHASPSLQGLELLA